MTLPEPTWTVANYQDLTTIADPQTPLSSSTPTRYVDNKGVDYIMDFHSVQKNIFFSCPNDF